MRNDVVNQRVMDIVELYNNAAYFLDCVYILTNNNKHRLVVLHQRQTLFDKTYKTLDEAMKAFDIHFEDRRIIANAFPSWDLPAKVECCQPAYYN